MRETKKMGSKKPTSINPKSREKTWKTDEHDENYFKKLLDLHCKHKKNTHIHTNYRHPFLLSVFFIYSIYIYIKQKRHCVN